MDEKPTTPADNPDNNGSQATPPVEDPNTGTDNQTPPEGADNLDPSKSTDTPADGDKPADGAEDDKDTPASLKIDDDLDDWAEKTGRGKPESDRERAALQEIRNGQREFSKQQEAKKAADALKTATEGVETGAEDDEIDDPLEKDVAELKKRNAEVETARLQSEYFSENNVTTDEATAMGKVLQEMVDAEDTPEDKQRAFEYWTNPKRLEKWHRLAKAEIGTDSVDTKAIEDEAARKERERIAKESHSNGPSRNASTTPADVSAQEKRTKDLLDRWSK